MFVRHFVIQGFGSSCAAEHTLFEAPTFTDLLLFYDHKSQFSLNLSDIIFRCEDVL